MATAIVPDGPAHIYLPVIPHQYQLFRVFDFGREPRLYILHGSLRQLCQLDPVLYRAVV
ncbi:MAG TPA: hypothetical protein VKE74_02315 [Gemmataceae bacterium]|nr:hypothetical protein [Gemmataceae bacterium]